MLILAPQLITSRQTGKTIAQHIADEGLDTDLVFCLDGGALASFNAGDTKFKDLTANGYDFFLGNDGTSSNDPVFRGTPGSLDNTNYFDGYDSGYHRYDASNPAEINAIHQNSAAFTLMAIFRFQTPGGNNVAIAGTQGATGSSIGFRWGFLGSNAPGLDVGNGSGVALSTTASSSLTDNTDYILFLSFDEAAGSGFQRANKTGIHTISATYSSPSASAAAFAMELMKPGNAELGSWASDARLYGFAMWNAALSAANCDAIQDAINNARGYV